MALQSHDLLDVVLFLLLVLSDSKARPAHFLLGVLNLREEIFVLTTDRFDGVVETLDLLAGISIVSQDVLFLDFKGSGHLLRPSFLIDEFTVLVFEQIVGVRAFAELLIDKAILSCQCLDIFSHLSHLLSFKLS